MLALAKDNFQATRITLYQLAFRKSPRRSSSNISTNKVFQVIYFLKTLGQTCFSWRTTMRSWTIYLWMKSLNLIFRVFLLTLHLDPLLLLHQAHTLASPLTRSLLLSTSICREFWVIDSSLLPRKIGLTIGLEKKPLLK